MKKNILIVEDDKTMARTIKEYLPADKYEIRIVYNGVDAASAIREHWPNGVLLDLNLPDMFGFEILKNYPPAQFNYAAIVVTGESTMSNAIEAIQRGAQDFIPKPVSKPRLLVSLENAVEKIELKKIANAYEKISRDSFHEFIGKSPQMQAIYNVLENASQTTASVFITGESGTGKELAAKALHEMSPRSHRSFEVLNCAAIPHNLLESEIFGHVKGAFTGATSTRIGAAMRADGGTLFLDEIGEMPLALQAKLLRFIQTGKFYQVGGNKEHHVNIRFIAATNRDPYEAIKKQFLREDLFYRLNVIPVNMPSLRERREDIVPLSRHFLKKYAQKEGKKFESIHSAVEDDLERRDWNGNVRELENVIFRAVALNKGSILETTHLKNLGNKEHSYSKNNRENEKSEFLPQIPDDLRPLRDYEKDIIQAAIASCGGNITEAAKRLDINPATIHRKQKQWESVV